MPVPPAECVSVASSRNPYVLMNPGGGIAGVGRPNLIKFTVILSTAAVSTTCVPYATRDYTALDGVNYRAVRGVLIFAPGESSKDIPVTLLPDAEASSTRSFYLDLGTPVNATLLQTLSVGTIINGDLGTPALSIADVSLKRGLSGTKPMNLIVSLSTASTQPVTFTIATRDVSAVAGVDYVAIHQNITIPAGTISVNIPVTIYGASVPTADKVFLADLSAASVDIVRVTGAGILEYGN